MIMTAKEKLQKALEAKAQVQVKLMISALFLNEGWVPDPTQDALYFITFDPERQTTSDSFKSGVTIDVNEYNDIPLGMVLFKTEALAQKALDELTEQDVKNLFMNEFEGIVVNDGKAYLQLDAETVGYCAHATLDQNGVVTSNDVVTALRDAGYWATHAFVDPTLYNYATNRGWAVVRSKGYNEYYEKLPSSMGVALNANDLKQIDLQQLLGVLLAGSMPGFIIR